MISRAGCQLSAIAALAIITSRPSAISLTAFAAASASDVEVASSLTMWMFGLEAANSLRAVAFEGVRTPANTTSPLLAIILTSSRLIPRFDPLINQD